jgi:hypothetical protein
MSKEEIPNGYVRRMNDKCVFVRIDDNGKCGKEILEYVITTGWENLMVDGKFRDDLIVFVRLLKETGEMRQISVLAYKQGDKMLPISELGTMKQVTEMIEQAWKSRVEEVKYIEDLSMELYTDCKKNGIIKE